MKYALISLTILLLTTPVICLSLSGSVTWGYEDWYGSGGGIAEYLDITGDGSMIYVAWNLNYERISAFEAEGNGIPVWEYDLREGSTYGIFDTVIVRVSDGNDLLVASVKDRYLVGQENYDSVLYCLDPDTGAISWSVIMPQSTYEPENTERITHLEVAAGGSLVAVVTKGHRNEPVYEPYHIYIYNPAGTLLHTIELPDPDHEIMRVNDIKITDNGSRMVVDFRRTQNPSHLIKVWNLETFTEIQSFSYTNSPVETTIGLSGDGGVLGIGNLNGRLRVLIFNNEDEEYQEIWSFGISSSDYNPWVSAIDISKDGSILAMGSFEPIETEENGCLDIKNQGYLYVFDVAAGPSYIYKSLDFGDIVWDVTVSDNGEVAVGASWGPLDNPAQGWDLIAFSTVSGEDIYRMEGTYPGSLFDCEINSNGTRVAAGGKRIHAGQFGSGGWAYSIELDEVFPPTQTPTPEFTSTPTHTNTPTSTPTCPPSGAWCDLNKELYRSGDRFLLSLTACNGSSEESIQNPIFLILDVYGTYFCAPAWTDCSEYPSWFDWDIDPCSCQEEDILDFIWPSDVGEADNIYFLAAMVNDTFTDIIGDISTCAFGWR